LQDKQNENNNNVKNIVGNQCVKEGPTA